jgi:GT2 family glycosyltransferase
MIAGLLAACGWHVGDKKQLLPAAADNPLGFWERQDVVALNDSLLEAAGGCWFRPAAIESKESSDDLEKVLGELGSHAPWLIKDPRLLLTWPAWSGALSDTLKLFVYRGPLAVATSLQKRHGFPLQFGLDLWEFYNRQALMILESSEFIATSYDAFSAAPELACSALRERLAQQGVQLDEGQAATYFEQKLNHAPAKDDSEHRLSPQQMALHECCVQLCESGDSEFSLPAASPGLAQRIQEYAGAFAELADVPALRIAVEQAQLERDKARQDYTTASDLAATVRSAHQRDSKELDFLREERSVRDAEIELLQQHVADWTQRWEEANAKAEHLFHQLDTNYLKLIQFQGSLPGRMAGFFSSLYKLLTLRRGQQTAYEDVIVDARVHVQHYESSLPTARQSRLQMGWSVINYLLRHPVASLRSFSWHRLRRALAVFFGSNNSDLQLWIGQRFPDIDDQHQHQMDPDLDAALDTLQLAFTEQARPKVSIVIPVYNEYRMTLFCLRSLLENTAGVEYEVIIADDASTDLTQSIAQRVTGICVERAPHNQGFVRNCNAGAQQARGEFLLFLNNDTAFTEGWLEQLLLVLETDPEVGIVGPMLLFGDGRLQEAGGIVWDDASGWNYGRLDDSSRPQYNYRRETDYVSGACLLIRAGLWQQLGGFDERYVPAYYEDTDLCFAARSAGFKVIYQPASRIYHFEGISNGTDLGAGIKQHQLVNCEKFRDKWQDTLREQHFPNGEQVFLARDRSRNRRTVLVIDHYVPSYDKDAGSRSTWMYLQLMVEMGYNVKFIGANFFPHQPYTNALQAQGIEVLVGEHMARNLSAWLQEHANNIDVVYIHRPHVAEQFLKQLSVLKPRSKIMYFGHDLHFLRIEREFAVTAEPALVESARQWKARELAVFDAVDQVYYPSQIEIDVIRNEAPQVKASAIPLYVLDVQQQAHYNWEQRKDILFVAGFGHPPNVDGLIWFVDEVMPLVWQECPELSLHVVGSNAPAAVTKLANERVWIHGYLSDEDLALQYASARMVAVPLRFGAGVKGKVLEAVQYGVPLVTTAVGAEGLPDADSVFNIEDTPAGFAAAIVELNGGDQSRLQRRERYGDYLRNNFSKARASDILCRDFGDPVIEREANQ